MRDLAEPMALANLGRIEGLLHRPKISNGDVQRLHLRNPVLASVLHKNPGKNGSQFVPVRGPRPAIAEFATGEIGTAKNVDDQAAVQSIVGAGDVKRRVGGAVHTD